MSGPSGFGASAFTGPVNLFLFAAEYDFLPEGVRRIGKILDKRLSLEGLVSPSLG
jgi:hypothetical protein